MPGYMIYLLDRGGGKAISSIFAAAAACGFRLNLVQLFVFGLSLTLVDNAREQQVSWYTLLVLPCTFLPYDHSNHLMFSSERGNQPRLRHG
jgi:hypothetical protein